MVKNDFESMNFAIFEEVVHNLGMTMTWFSEKMLISNICIFGLMPNLIKKSWKVSSFEVCYHKNKEIVVLWTDVPLTNIMEIELMMSDLKSLYKLRNLQDWYQLIRSLLNCVVSHSKPYWLLTSNLSFLRPICIISFSHLGVSLIIRDITVTFYAQLLLWLVNTSSAYVTLKSYRFYSFIQGV